MKPELDIEKLCKAIQASRKALEWTRARVFEMTAEEAGDLYSENSADKPVYCNLLGQYKSIIGRKLIAHNPRVLISTASQEALPTVHAMQDWINKEIVRQNLFETLGEARDNAFYCMGIVQVGLATPGDSALTGWRIKAGDPYACSIHIDDFAFDMHCKKIREAGWMAHRYRVPVSTIKGWQKAENDMGDADAFYNAEGDARITMIGRSFTAGDREEYEDFCDLWQVWVPRHKVIVTLADSQVTGFTSGWDAGLNPLVGKAIAIRPWIGPECGPYHLLPLDTVSGNPLPKGPMQGLYNLAMSINKILRKLIDDAENYKCWTGVTGGAGQDGSRVVNANHGEVIKLDDPKSIVTQESRVPNQNLYMIFEALRKLFSWLAGNLDVQGGLAADADTATQEKMLNSNSSATVLEMQQRMIDFTESVMRAFGWFYHYNPETVMRGKYEAPGMPGMAVERNVYPAGQGMDEYGQPRLARDHDFEMMDIKLDPYSLPHNTPQQRLAALNGFIQQTYLPMAQLFQAQGVTLDINQYTTMVGELIDEPRLKQLFTVGEKPPVEEQGGQSAEQPGVKPPQTSREYVRRSQGSQGEQNSLLNMLSQGRGPGGANGQPSMNGSAA